MAMLTWGPALEVGDREIDAQHRRLVDLLNQAHRAAIGRATRHELSLTLADLVAYTQVHFDFEERLITRYHLDEGAGDIDAAEHREEHRELTGVVHNLVDRFEAGDDVADELLVFLADWLQRHILGTDATLADELRRARAGAPPS